MDTYRRYGEDGKDMRGYIRLTAAQVDFFKNKIEEIITHPCNQRFLILAEQQLVIALR